MRFILADGPLTEIANHWLREPGLREVITTLSTGDADVDHPDGIPEHRIPLTSETLGPAKQSLV
ncbi:hypothetical protein ETD83_04750 [Actinomadura soli]|uniref:Uncharacterized protein n=1 Tax=Actinomadura soli TaxID=2508997 RepID=A0A5C4JHP2_9ACTN|nr:hypothetical protein [Actinomadura soli]TMR06407.1 hypothetical protein ETD83_04750 [Actinomadura soli]